MTTEGLSLAVWRDCDACVLSRGTLPSGRDCWKCKGLGKQPTFIPLDELTMTLEMLENGGIRVTKSPDLRVAIAEWMERQDAAAEPVASAPSAQVPATQENCYRCGGTGRALFWNGTKVCGDCSGTGKRDPSVKKEKS